MGASDVESESAAGAAASRKVEANVAETIAEEFMFTIPLK